MTERKIEVYPYAAGGWGALKSAAKQLIRERIAAKGARTMLSANQPGGFDCPGCAWPDRDHTSTFEFCENGVKAVAAEATAARATPELIGSRTVAEWAALPDEQLEAQGRLTHPLVWRAETDRFEAIEWDAAFALIAAELQALEHPDQALFYTSGRTSNEAAFLYQLFVREFGTNNLPNCSNMCHEPSGAALQPTLGVGKGTVTLADFEQADAIFIFGQNPGTNHPRMLGELRQAARRGARIVSFNPLRERGLERFTHPQSPLEMATLSSTAISSHYFQPRIGGDLAAVKGLCKQVLALDDAALAAGRPRVLDIDFIATHTTGFEALVQDLRAQPWDELELESGLTRAQIETAAEVYVQAPRTIICWGMGITQHQHAVGTIQMLLNLLLMRGNLGVPGAGVCPVRGHSNVQGDRTMGIDEKPTVAFLDRLQAVFGFDPPRRPGLNTVAAIEAMRSGQARVFFGMGGNFAAATPDTTATWEGLRRCALTVHVATKLNRSHLVHGRRALVLPCLGRTEVDHQARGPQQVTVEDSMSMVHLSGGLNAPASSLLLSEPAIVARLAQACLPRSRVPWAWLVEDYARIRDKIEAVFPDFHDFNARVARPGGFRLRNTASERVWATASGRAEFRVHAVPRDSRVHQARRARAAGLSPVMTLATVRSHDQYNTTIYGLDDRYRGVHGQRRVVFMHADDMAAQGLRPGQFVDLLSAYPDEAPRRVEGFALVAYDIPRGCLAAYYPETNALLPLSCVAEGAGTPTSKSIPVVLSVSVAHPTQAGDDGAA